MSNKDTNFLQIDYSILRNKNFTGNEKLVYAYLLSFKKSTGSIFPATQTIADDLGLSKTSVIGLLQKLEEKGAIGKTIRYNKSTIYEVKPLNQSRNLTASSQESLPPEVKKLDSTISSTTSPTTSNKEEVTEESQDDIPNSNISSTVYSLPPCTRSVPSLKGGSNNYEIDPNKEREFLQRIRELKQSKETGVPIF